MLCFHTVTYMVQLKGEDRPRPTTYNTAQWHADGHILDLHERRLSREVKQRWMTAAVTKNHHRHPYLFVPKTRYFVSIALSTMAILQEPMSHIENTEKPRNAREIYTKKIHTRTKNKKKLTHLFSADEMFVLLKRRVGFPVRLRWHCTALPICYCRPSSMSMSIMNLCSAKPWGMRHLHCILVCLITRNEFRFKLFPKTVRTQRWITETIR